MCKTCIKTREINFYPLVKSHPGSLHFTSDLAKFPSVHFWPTMLKVTPFHAVLSVVCNACTVVKQYGLLEN